MDPVKLASRPSDPYRRARLLLAGAPLLAVLALSAYLFTEDLRYGASEASTLLVTSLLVLGLPFVLYFVGFRTWFGSVVMGTALVLGPTIAGLVVFSRPLDDGLEALIIPYVLWGIFVAGTVAEGILRFIREVRLIRHPPRDD